MTRFFKKTTLIENRISTFPGKAIGFLFSILLHILIVFLLISTRFPIQQELIRNEIREIRLASPENGSITGNQNISRELRDMASKKQHSDNPKMMHYLDSGTITGMATAPIPEFDFTLTIAKNMSLSKYFPDPEAALYSNPGFLNLKKLPNLQGKWQLNFPGQLTFIPSVSTDMNDMLYKVTNSYIPGQVSRASEQVDLTAWSENILDRIHQQWIIPSSALTGQKGRVKIQARIKADGSILSIKITTPSPEKTYNQAAKKAIFDSNPFPPLPDNFSKNWVEMVVLFYYND